MEHNGIWHEQHEVAFHHCDQFGHLSQEALQATLAAAAGNHAFAHGVSTDLLESQGKLWVLNHIETDIFAPLRWREVFLLRTWVQDMRGAGSYRRFDLHRPDGTLLAQALSRWALLDLQTMRPVRVESLNIEFPQHPVLPAFDHWPL